MKEKVQKMESKTILAQLDPAAITEALESAIEALAPEDREVIEDMVAKAQTIRGVGRSSALELVGKISLAMVQK